MGWGPFLYFSKSFDKKLPLEILMNPFSKIFFRNYVLSLKKNFSTYTYLMWSQVSNH